MRTCNYYIDTDIYARFFCCEKPLHDLFLTNVNKSESPNDFFTRAKTVSSNQREPVFTYQRIRSRPAKFSARMLIKLLAISCVLNFISSLNWTISNVYIQRFTML